MVEEVLIRMGVDSRPVSYALRGVRKDFAQFKQDLKSLNPMDVFSSTLGQLGIGLSIAGIAAMSKQAMEFADQIKSTAERVDVAGSTLQAFSLQVATNGGEVEDASKALEKLAIKIGEARQGTATAIEVFDKLGVKLDDANGKARGNEDIFYDVADAIKSIEDPAIKSAMRLEIFSKAGKGVALAMEEGSKGIKAFKEANKGSLLSDAELGQLAAANDKLTELSFKAKTLSGRLLMIAVEAFSTGKSNGQIWLEQQMKERERNFNEGEASKFEANALKAKAIAEEVAKLEKAKRDRTFDRLNAEMKASYLLDEARTLHREVLKTKEGTVERVQAEVKLQEKLREFETAKVASDKYKLDREKKVTDELEKQKQKRERELEMVNRIRDAALKGRDLAKDLYNSKADRSKFSLQDLANMPLWGRSPQMRGFILDAQMVMDMESEARYMASFGNFAGSQRLFGQSDQIRGGILALNENERRPFASMEKSIDEQNKSLQELIRKASQEGLNVSVAIAN